MKKLIQKRIVAEATKNWPETTKGSLAQRFEGIIEYNATQGYELESWQLSTCASATPMMGVGFTETIIAVFIETERTEDGDTT